MKRIVTVGDTSFIIEGYYNPKKYYNYYVYNPEGNRPFEAGHISVKGEMKPLCVPVAFRRLRDAKDWLKDGCPVRRGLALIWAAHSNAADAALAGARKERDDGEA